MSVCQLTYNFDFNFMALFGVYLTYRSFFIYKINNNVIHSFVILLVMENREHGVNVDVVYLPPRECRRPHRQHRCLFALTQVYMKYLCFLTIQNRIKVTVLTLRMLSIFCVLTFGFWNSNTTILKTNELSLIRCAL